jgi:hypothetical protein
MSLYEIEINAFKKMGISTTKRNINNTKLEINIIIKELIFG